MTITIQFREAFARKLIKLRKEHKLTQEDIAAAIGIKQPRYAAYEERRSEPPIAVLRLLAKYYGETLDQLVNVEYSA